MNQGSEITTIVQDHVQALATRESSKGLFNAPGILLLRLALPGKYRNTSSSNARVTWLYAWKRTI